MDMNKAGPNGSFSSCVSDTLERSLKLLDVGVWEWSPASGAIAWTPAVERIYGMPPGSFTGDFEQVLTFIHPDDRDAWRRDVDRCLAGEADHDVIFRIVTRDDDYRWVHASGQIERDSAGDVHRMIGAVVDVTDRIRCQDSVSLLYDQALNLLIEASPRGVIQHVSRGWQELLGYRPDALEGQQFLDYVHPDDLAATAREMDRVVRGAPSLDFENRLRTADGAYRRIRWSSSRSSQRDVLVSVGQDVTDQERALAELRDTGQQLGLALQSAELGVWTYDVETDHLHWDDRQLALYGLASGAFDHRLETWRSMLLPEDREACEDAFAKLYHEGSVNGIDCRIRRPDGEVRHIRASGIVVASNDRGPTQLLGVNCDVTERKRAEERLHYQAQHDPLTGLPNRLLLRERLEQRILHSHRRGTSLAVMFIDLDFFKTVNDALGHDAGDRLLVQISERLRASCRAEDTVARISGDEFVMLMGAFTDGEAIGQAVEHVRDALQQPLAVDDGEVLVSASIGVAVCPGDGQDAETLLRHADAAMYLAKDQGRNNYQFFNADLAAAASEQRLLRGALRQALQKGQLHLVYQPQVDLVTGACLGVEALVRWEHPERGLVGPDQFIPVAMKSGLISDVSAWVFREACSRAATWLREGLDIGCLSVNVAFAQLYDDGFPDLVARVLMDHELPPSRLSLEVSETGLMSGGVAFRTVLESLKALGVKLVVDDFGTGASSLPVLRALPVDTLKIHRSFVGKLPADEDSAAIVATIIAMAKQLRLGVIAEGIATPSQADFLVNGGCPSGQGFLFGRPLPEQDLLDYLQPVRART